MGVRWPSKDDSLAAARVEGGGEEEWGGMEATGADFGGGDTGGVGGVGGATKSKAGDAAAAAVVVACWVWALAWAWAWAWAWERRDRGPWPCRRALRWAFSYTVVFSPTPGVICTGLVFESSGKAAYGLAASEVPRKGLVSGNKGVRSVAVGDEKGEEAEGWVSRRGGAREVCFADVLFPAPRHEHRLPILTNGGS